MKNRTYGNCKLLIAAGRYEYGDMYNKLDLFLMMDRITEDEYVELTGMLAEPEPAAPEVTPVEPEPPAEEVPVD